MSPFAAALIGLSGTMETSSAAGEVSPGARAGFASVLLRGERAHLVAHARRPAGRR